MQIVLVIVAVCIVIAIFEKIKEKLEDLGDFIGRHKYFFICLIISIVVAVFAGSYAGIGVSILFLSLWCLYKLYKKSASFFQQLHEKKLISWINSHGDQWDEITLQSILKGDSDGVIPKKYKNYSYPSGRTFASITRGKILELLNKIWLSHRMQFEQWLEANGYYWGQVTVEGLIDGPKRDLIPQSFKSLSYPPEVTCVTILEPFLIKCNNAAAQQVEDAIYGFVSEKGMVPISDVRVRVANSCRCTYERSLVDSVITNMESHNLIDRPTDDKRTLHCVGATSGTDFETEEIDIDI